MSTAYHAQYWAYALTLRGASDTVQNLSRAISNARVDLNPHQVDAALFAVRSPLSKGVILADEVGLGKTIEAGLVISQRWAERRRKVLVIVPASLRKQWQQELGEKFFLPSTILEGASYKRLIDERRVPFELENQLVICSYQFVVQHADEVAHVSWDLVVIDEAHRLRNVYNPGAKTAQAIVAATGSAPKLLLTATPLQNNLMELYGLVSVLDPHVFGDPTSFREQFVRAPEESARNRLLKLRLKDFCQRTLRRQVLEYVPFTRRMAVTQAFRPDDDEHELYERVSDYLRRKVLYALPAGQRTLMTMVLRKLLASSSFAIGDTLEGLVQRLRGIQSEAELALQLRADVDSLDELHDELGESAEDSADGDDDTAEDTADSDTNPDPAAVGEEIAALSDYLALARGISANAKAGALLKALDTGFAEAAKLGAARKAVVFTESRRTQEYLLRVLNECGFAGRVVLINGANTDEGSRRILEKWRATHADDGVPSGARAVDVKAAIVEAFRDEAEVLLATEAAAEGVNLQFCSLVVNYDLPWNPQRVEQRIGRCHRYGQKHNVVVVNFLNERNAADQRVLQLLGEKFRLFEGVFGASDEVLGTIESGIDIERRLMEVYRSCRTAEEIAAAFDALQVELEQQIRAQMAQTRQAILDHFDEDVQARLHVHRDQAVQSLDQRQRWLLSLTRFELADSARFDPDIPRFHYAGNLAPKGPYHFDWREAERRGETFYRVDHPLAVAVVERAKGRELPACALDFSLRPGGAKVAVLEPFVGAAGWLTLGLLTVASLDTEDFLVFAGGCDDGRVFDAELCQRLMGLPAAERGVVDGEPKHTPPEAEIARCIGQVEARNARFFDAEVAKLDRWSDDLKIGLEREIRDIDAEIKEARKQAAVAIALADKLEAQRAIKTLETRRNHKRRDLFDEQDRIDGERADLIAGIERQLAASHSFRALYTVRFTLGDLPWALDPDLT